MSVINCFDCVDVICCEPQEDLLRTLFPTSKLDESHLNILLALCKCLNLIIFYVAEGNPSIVNLIDTHSKLPTILENLLQENTNSSAIAAKIIRNLLLLNNSNLKLSSKILEHVFNTVYPIIAFYLLSFRTNSVDHLDRGDLEFLGLIIAYISIFNS